jgi:hypothetical protein
MSAKPTLVQLILNATTAGKAMLTAANAAAQKTLLSLVKGDVGLGNVDNTSDVNKPISSAQQTALDAKQATLVSGTNIKTVNSSSLLGSGDLAISGLSGTGSVDNAALRADGTGGATLQSSSWILNDNLTASPNNTVNHACIEATGGTTNVSVSIKPKGSGAFCLSAPDGTSAGGNARGANAIDLQTLRTAATQVAAGTQSTVCGTRNTAGSTSSTAVGWNNAANASTGTRASCFGYANTANVPRGVAMGHANTSSGNYGSAVGYSNTASGAYSSAIGRNNTSSSSYASAFGNFCVASAAKASAFGYRAKSAVANTVEVGYWSNATTRGGSLRIHGTTGMSSLTIQDRSTAYADGGATLGSEADNTVGRGMFAVRRNGDELLIDVNIAGTVKTLSLGTAT